MLEYFYFSVNKAFKDYSYDVREITEEEFKLSDSEFLVKFWEDSDSEGRPKIGYWSCFPKMEISYKKNKPTTFELNGITFSSYHTHLHVHRKGKHQMGGRLWQGSSP